MASYKNQRQREREKRRSRSEGGGGKGEGKGGDPFPLFLFFSFLFILEEETFRWAAAEEPSPASCGRWESWIWGGGPGSRSENARGIYFCGWGSPASLPSLPLRLEGFAAPGTELGSGKKTPPLLLCSATSGSPGSAEKKERRARVGREVSSLLCSAFPGGALAPSLLPHPRSAPSSSPSLLPSRASLSALAFPERAVAWTFPPPGVNKNLGGDKEQGGGLKQRVRDPRPLTLPLPPPGVPLGGRRGAFPPRILEGEFFSRPPPEVPPSSLLSAQRFRSSGRGFPTFFEVELRFSSFFLF